MIFEDRTEHGSRKYLGELLITILKDFSSINKIILKHYMYAEEFVLDGHDTVFLEIVVDEAKYVADILRFGQLDDYLNDHGDLLSKGFDVTIKYED